MWRKDVQVPSDEVSHLITDHPVVSTVSQLTDILSFLAESASSDKLNVNVGRGRGESILDSDTYILYLW